MNTGAHASSFPGRLSVGQPVVQSFARRAALRVADLRHVGWDLGLVVMERVAGYRRGGEKIDFHLAASARDLVAQKSRAVRTEMEWLAQAVQSTGSYAARDEASRALQAVMDALSERVPPELLTKLCDHLPEAEAERLREAVERRRESAPAVEG